MCICCVCGSGYHIFATFISVKELVAAAAVLNEVSDQGMVIL